MKQRMLAYIGLAMGVASPLAVRAQADSVKPVVLAVSGGVSLGAYQGGVNWGLIWLLRRTDEQNPAFRNKFSGGWKLPLVAATGASAGNLNSVFSAVEWCKDHITPPESSLFWKAWVRVGWEQLYPQPSATPTGPFHRHVVEADSRAHSVFHRRYFDAELRPMLESADSAGIRSNCDVPIGIVVTRREPETVTIDSVIQVPVQRIVSGEWLKSDGAGGANFHEPTFIQPGEHRLGRFIYLTGDTSRHDDRLPVASVYDLSTASAAYPVAFEPKPLSYYDGLGPNGTCQPVAAGGKCRSPHVAAFVDGGLFDNDPIGFARDLYGVYRSQEKPTWPANPWLVFISPSQRRSKPSLPTADFPITASGEPRAVTAKGVTCDVAHDGAYTNPDTGDTGLHSVLRTILSAVNSARNYELFSLSRALCTSDTSQVIGVTDRYANAVGDYFDAFGAFLGRPFREYDYYVGVYDAIHFLAREVTCGRYPGLPATEAAKRSGGPDRQPGRQETLDECTARVSAELIDSLPPASGTLGRVVSELWRREFDPVNASPPALQAPRTAEDSERAVLVALVEANDQVLRDQRAGTIQCSGKPPLEYALCSGGFEELLTIFKTYKVGDRTVFNIIDAFANNPQCASFNWPTAPDHCEADHTLRDLLDHPPRKLDALARDILDELAWSEDHLPTDNVKYATATTELTYRLAIAHRYHIGFTGSQALLPSNASFVWDIVPEHIDFDGSLASARRSGVDFGYRPTLDLGLPVHLFAPINLYWRQYQTAASPNGDEGYHPFASAGVGIGTTRTGWLAPYVTRIDASGQFVGRLAHERGLADVPTPLIEGSVIGFEIVRIGVQRWSYSKDQPLPGKWTLSVGLANVNGLGYWLWHAF